MKNSSLNGRTPAAISYVIGSSICGYAIDGSPTASARFCFGLKYSIAISAVRLNGAFRISNWLHNDDAVHTPTTNKIASTRTGHPGNRRNDAASHRSHAGTSTPRYRGSQNGRGSIFPHTQ